MGLPDGSDPYFTRGQRINLVVMQILAKKKFERKTCSDEQKEFIM